MNATLLRSLNSLWRIVVILAILQLFHLNSTGASTPTAKRAYSSSIEESTDRSDKRSRSENLDLNESDTKLMDECMKSENVQNCCSSLLNNYYNRAYVKDHVPTTCSESFCKVIVEKGLTFHKTDELNNTCHLALGNVYNGADIVYLYEFLQFARPTGEMISTLLRGLTFPSNFETLRTLEHLITSHGNDYHFFNQVLREPTFPLSEKDIFDCLCYPQIYTVYKLETAHTNQFKIHFLKVKWIVMSYYRINKACPLGDENSGITNLIYTVERMTQDPQYGTAISEAITAFLRHNLTATDVSIILELIVNPPQVIVALTPPPYGTWNQIGWTLAKVIEYAANNCAYDNDYYICFQKWINIIYNLNSLNVNQEDVVDRFNHHETTIDYVDCLYSLTLDLAFDVTYRAACTISKELVREMFFIYYFGSWNFNDSTNSIKKRFKDQMYNQVMHDENNCINFIHVISNLKGTYIQKWNEIRRRS